MVPVRQAAVKLIIGVPEANCAVTARALHAKLSGRRASKYPQSVTGYLLLQHGVTSEAAALVKLRISEEAGMQARYSSQALQATLASSPLAVFPAGNVWYYKQVMSRSQRALLLTLDAGLCQ